MGDTMSASKRLGESVNLLEGLAPGWFGGAGAPSPFTRPPREALLALDAPPRKGTGAWCGPDIGFHASIEALIDALFDYRVRPMPGDAGRFDLPPSAWMLGGGRRKATLARLEHLLGVPAAQLERGGLVLLQFRRDDAGERHPLEESGAGRPVQVERYWTREGRHAAGRLRVAERGDDGREPLLRRSQAERCIDYLYEYGTHFVSRIGMGDRLFQVLACQPGRHDLLRSLWRQAAGAGEPGVSAAAFAAYLGDAWIGWHGHLVSAAQDPAFERSLLDGRWRLPEAGMRASLLAALHRDACAWLDGFRRSVPVRLGFSAHGPYMEPGCASAWQRVAKGAWLQRYGDAVLVSAAGAGEADPAVPLVNHGESIVVAGRDGESLLVDRTEAIPAHLTEASMHAGVAHLFARRLGFGSDVVLPVRGALTLFGFAIDADLARGHMPTVCLEGDATAVVRCHTPVLHGALRLARTDGTHEVLSGGLHFGEDAQGRVSVLADLCQADAAVLAALRVPLIAAVDEAEAQWLRAAAAGLPATIATVRTELDWLLGCLRESGAIAQEAADRGDWDALFRRLALLARLGPTVPRLRADTSAPLIQTAAELLLHCRLANDAPHSEQQALAQACMEMSLGFDAATIAAAEPHAIDLARLAQCLSRIDEACGRAVRAIEGLLEELPATLDDNAQLMLLTMARLWSEEFGGATPPAPGEGRPALALQLLRAAEHDRRAAKLLRAVATHADLGIVDAAVEAMDGLGRHGLTLEQWHAAPGTIMSLLEPQGAELAPLADALRDWAAQGLRLAAAMPALQQGVQDRLRRGRAAGVPLPEAVSLRMMLASRRLQLQWVGAYGQGDAVAHRVGSVVAA